MLHSTDIGPIKTEMKVSCPVAHLKFSKRPFKNSFVIPVVHTRVSTGTYFDVNMPFFSLPFFRTCQTMSKRKAQEMHL